MDCVKSRGICTEEANQVVALPTRVADATVPLASTSPTARRGSSNLSLDCDSPHTVVDESHAPASPEDMSASVVGDPQTAKGSNLDPFAPVSDDDATLSSLCKRYNDQLRIGVVRSLTFGSSVKAARDRKQRDDSGSISDEQIFDILYQHLLDAVISMQKECFLEELSNKRGYSSDGGKTPPSAPRLGDLTADTCPGAPVKPARKSRNVDSGLCRKLF